MKYRAKARLTMWIVLVLGSLFVMLASGCEVVDGAGKFLQNASDATRTGLAEYSAR